MAELINTVQLQETDDALITLFDITLPSGTIVYFMNGLDDGSTNVYFPQKEISGSTYPLKEYVAIPIQVEGFESSSSGATARPTLSVANIPVLSRSITNDSDGTDDENDILDILNTEGITSNEDLLNSRVVVRRTLFSKTYTSADSAPSSAPIEFPSQTYLIDRVSSENNIMVQFELASPMDIEGVVLPNRVVVGKYCPWKYQGHPLSSDGGCTWPLNSNGRFFDEHDNVITKTISSITTWTSVPTFSAGDKVKTITNGHTKIWEALRAVPANKDPESQKYYWKRLDVCGKTLNSCKIRFQGNNTDDTLNTAHVLPFGGFPGTKQFR